MIANFVIWLIIIVSNCAFSESESEMTHMIRKQAKWRGEIIAESDKTILVENNEYFPPGSLKMDYFEQSDKTTVCPWKGTAHYYHVIVDGKKNKDAAWYYPEPSKAAERIKNYVAFWKGVDVITL